MKSNNKTIINCTTSNYISGQNRRCTKKKITFDRSSNLEMLLSFMLRGCKLIQAIKITQAFC